MKRYTAIFMVITMVMLLAACDINPGQLKVGELAPSLKTKTLADVRGDFSRITTYRHPDARMYQLSLDEALTKNKPILLEFATPGHCTVCDKQLQMLKAMVNKYGDDVLFLHMDQYMNPEAFTAFGVLGDPWTFVIGADQEVKFRRPGRMLYGEMDALLTETLADAG
ncbi:MAG: thioredoxin family protein [Gammaproteobacteria bacterium]|nr:thioredoxin family protein [Gammaproteobacteria bacterium]